MKNHRTELHDAERDAQIERFAAERKLALQEAARILEAAKTRVHGLLDAEPTDYQKWHLPRLERSVDAALEETGRELASEMTTRQGLAWSRGMELIDAPAAAGGVRLAAMLPKVSVEQLVGLQHFMGGKMRDVAARLADRIKLQVGLAVTGVTPVSEVVTAVEGMVDGGRKRAITIVRTELGRAYSAAAQARQEQAREVLPGLKKQWRKSGKLHGRTDHMAADGQIRKVNENFTVGGVEFLYPRSPDCPVGHAVNCGCVSLPYMESWEVIHPADVPMPEPKSESQARGQALVDAKTKAWIADLVDADKPHLHRDSRTVGTISDNVMTRLAVRGVAPVTREIGLSDARVRHLVPHDKRAYKTWKGIPPKEIKRLQEHLADPLAILWEEEKGSLVYVFEVPGRKRLGVLPVKLRDRDAKSKSRPHNWIQTGRMERQEGLRDVNRYELLEGEI